MIRPESGYEVASCFIVAIKNSLVHPASLNQNYGRIGVYQLI